MTEEPAPSNAILYARKCETGIEICYGPGDHTIKVIAVTDLRALNFATQLIELVTRRMGG